MKYKRNTMGSTVKYQASRSIFLGGSAHSFRVQVGCAFFACFVLLLSSMAIAQSSAFSDEVAVVDRSESEQQAAFIVAMRRVLLRNSGDKTLLNRDDIRAGLANAGDYVEQVQYRTPDAGQVIGRDVSVTENVRLSGQATQLMLVSFNQTLIRELIAKKASTSKPATAEENPTPFANVREAVVWILIDDNGQDVLVGRSNAENIVRRSNEIAGGLGLTLSFPQMDSADAASITAQDIRENNHEKILSASARYSSNFIAYADLTRARTGGWSGRWVRLNRAGQNEESAVSSTSLDASLQTGLGWLRSNAAPAGADSAANGVDYVEGNTSGPTQSESLIWVSSVNNLTSYADVLKFMSSVNSVSVVSVKEVSTDGIVFTVSPRGSVNDVAAAAAGVDWLRQTGTPASTSRSALSGQVELSLDYLR